VILLAWPALAQEPVTPPPGAAEAFRQFADLLDALQKHYVGEIKPAEHTAIAFRQFVRSLDPKADLLTPAQFAAAKTPTSATTNLPPPTLRFYKAGIAYCRLAEFSEPARQRLEFDLTRAVHERARGLLLDIRDNAGGALDPMLRIAKLFLPDKAEIVSLEFARPEQRVVFRSDASPKFTAPVVLLVNAGTAGEAEAFAAALRENRRARLVGRRTAGRTKNYGYIELPDGSALYIPNSRYSFDERGLIPDETTQDAAALDSALDLLEKSGSIRSDEPKTRR
jgi:hypothetical protein